MKGESTVGQKFLFRRIWGHDKENRLLKSEKLGDSLNGLILFVFFFLNGRNKVVFNLNLLFPKEGSFEDSVRSMKIL